MSDNDRPATPGGFGFGPPRGGDDDGTGGAPRPRRPERPAGSGLARFGPLAKTAVVLALLGLVAVVGSYAWREVLWYSSVDYLSVLVTETGTQVVLFLLGFLLTALAVASSLALAYRHRPIYAPTNMQQEALDHYRTLLDPLRKIIVLAGPALLGAFGGLAAANQWRQALLFLNRGDFGTTDPTFGMDVGFFVFTLPWLRFVESFLTMVVVLALIAAAFTHYVYGGLQLGPRAQTTQAARVHLAVLAALFVLLRAVGFWLDRYDLSVRDAGKITGLTYTDANAVLPTKQLLAVFAVICMALFLSTIWTRTWRWPIIGVAMLLVTSVVVGGIFPAAMQSLRVRPNEKELEAPYIAHNIAATRAAYGLDKVQVDKRYVAKVTPSAAGLRADADAIPGIRIVDPLVVSPTFKQLEANRAYYEFPDVLDVDRYVIDGKLQDTVIAARELDLEGIPQRNWVNDHTVYTHGYGVAAAYGNRSTSSGEPSFFIQSVPVQGKVTDFQPRIYFGESTREYSIVGGSNNDEFDYQSGEGEKKYRYTGNGGVPIDNFFKRAAYSIVYGHAQILLSDQVGDTSRLLDFRTPRERVERVAPWLTLDGNTYPAIVGDRIQWIIDGYTTSPNYPYSKLQALDSATSDTLTTRGSVSALQPDQVNYIRNSVKATVDAYDGTIRLYAWDDHDPVLKAWSAAFGNTVRPMSEISGDLMAHLRYPEDLFKVQRQLMTRYHVTDSGEFYSGGDFWRVPEDPTSSLSSKPDQPPYYLSIKMPGQDEPSFSLTTTFSPAGEGRPYLSGFMAVDSDAGSTAGQRDPDYGTIRMLNMSATGAVDGPAQVQNQIETSNRFSPDDGSLTLQQFFNLSQSGVTITRGNLLTLPLSGGLLYVQPIYQRRATAGSQSYPTARAVVVTFGKQVAWAASLGKALDGLFSTDTGTATTPSPTPSSPTTPSGPAPSGKPTTAAERDAAYARIVTEISTYIAEGKAAQQKGDWAAYGAAQKKLEDAVNRAMALRPAGGSTTLPSASPSPTASG